MQDKEPSISSEARLLLHILVAFTGAKSPCGKLRLRIPYISLSPFAASAGLGTRLKMQAWSQDSSTKKRGQEPHVLV